jgi:hypothetical protein
MVAAQTFTGEGPTTALGQKRLQEAMSALPPKADMCGATSDVRFGSKADMCGARAHVRFTPESGHMQRNHRCPLWAKSRHCTSLCLLWANSGH